MIIGTAVSWHGGTFHQGDALMLTDPLAAGIMEYAGRTENRFVLYLKPLVFVASSGMYSIWKGFDTMGGEMHELTRQRPLRQATAWYHNEDDTIIIVE